MGLIVITVIALTVLVVRRLWRRAIGRPMPRISVRTRAHVGRVRSFVDGLGKSRTPARVTPLASPVEIEAWRCAAEAAKTLRTSSVDAPVNDCEVLVVGAGPSGLMTAALLVRQGVRVRIVDANSGPATESRAFAVQARTIELFASIGLGDELLSRGVVTTGIRFHIKGKPVGGLDFDRSRASDTPYQYLLMAPQSEVEELLLHDLARHGVTVERGAQLESMTQNENAVTAHLDRANLPSRSITAAYVVGADGAHSAVRKGLGLAFDGDRYTQSYLLADCRVEWPFDHTQFRVFMNGRRAGLFLPLHGSELSRVMTTDVTTQEGADPEPITLELLQDELRKAIKVPVTLSHPVWTTRYSAHLRGVEQYRVGRAFLVGDAAHIHSPAGGQGMNTGLQDAANLAWKLGAVLKTGAAPVLLDSYHAERHPAGLQVLKFSNRLYTLAAGLSGVRARVRDTVGPFLLKRMSAAPIPHRTAFRRLSQIGLSYRPSDYNVNALLYSLKGPHAGDRAPDARIRTDCRMFDLLQGYRLQVVAISRRHLTSEQIAVHTAQLDSLAAFGGSIQTHLVSRVAGRRDERVEHVDFTDLFERYGLTDEESEALYVIRPDGHVAWRMDALDHDACRRFLSRLHGGIADCEAQRVAEAA